MRARDAEVVGLDLNGMNAGINALAVLRGDSFRNMRFSVEESAERWRFRRC